MKAPIDTYICSYSIDAMKIEKPQQVIHHVNALALLTIIESAHGGKSKWREQIRLTDGRIVNVIMLSV